MSLKNLLNTMKTDTVLVGEIDRYLMKPNKGSGFVKDDRAKNVWHPSSLGGCPRALIMQMEGIPKSNGKISAVGQRIFDVGHHFGYMIQEYFYDMGILYGEWKCRKCEHRWTDLFKNPSPKVCPNCGEKLWIWYNLDYLEVPVYDEEYNIKGHADCLVKTLGKFRVVELKTIKNRTKGTSQKSVTYDELNKPKDNHIWQVQLYTYSLKKEAEKQLEKLEDIVVLYGAKNDQGIKEFKLRLMEDMYIKPQLEKITMMEEHIRKGIIPNRPKGCTSKSSYGCRFCDYKDLCYSTESNKIKDFMKGE